MDAFIINEVLGLPNVSNVGYVTKDKKLIYSSYGIH